MPEFRTLELSIAPTEEPRARHPFVLPANLLTTVEQSLLAQPWSSLHLHLKDISPSQFGVCERVAASSVVESARRTNNWKIGTSDTVVVACTQPIAPNSAVDRFRVHVHDVDGYVTTYRTGTRGKKVTPCWQPVK